MGCGFLLSRSSFCAANPVEPGTESPHFCFLMENKCVSGLESLQHAEAFLQSISSPNDWEGEVRSSMLRPLSRWDV